MAFTAVGRSYASIFAGVSGTSISSDIFGVYEDRYIKLENRWLFKSRHFKSLHTKSFTKKIRKEPVKYSSMIFALT